MTLVFFNKIKQRLLLKITGFYFCYFIVKYLFNAFIARHSSPAFYGDFRLAFATLLFLSQLIILGSNKATEKYLSQYVNEDNQAYIQYFTRWNTRFVLKCILVFIIILFLFYSVLGAWHIYQLKSMSNYHLLIYMLIITPAMSLVLCLASYLNAVKKFLWVAFTQSVLVFLIPLCILFLSTFFFNFKLSVSGLVLFLLLGYSGSALLQYFLLKKNGFYLFFKMLPYDSLEKEKIKQWKNFSVKMIVNACLFSFASMIDLYIIELIPVYGDQNLGYFSACLAIIAVLWVPNSVTITLLTPYLSLQNNNDDNKKHLQSILDKVNLFGLVVFVIINAFFFVFGQRVLLFFGPSYTHLYWMLNFMVVGYSIVIFLNTSELYLALNGGENTLTVLNIIKIFANIVFLSLSYYYYNLWGLVVSLISIRIVEILVMAFIAKIKTTLRLNLFF